MADRAPARPVLEGRAVTLAEVLRACERGPDGEFHDGLLMDMLATELRCGL